MLDYTRLRTIAQVAEAPGSPFTESTLRWKVFNARKNGLDKALVKVGRRVYLDLDAFNEWLEQGRGGGAADGT